MARFLSAAGAIGEFVAPGSTVGVGGMHMTAAPMSLVGELVRGEVRIGRLITSPSASIQADVLIGAGLVDEIMSPYVGFEHMGLAPCFRRAVEQQDLRVLECDEGSLTHALYAGAGGIPFIPCPPGIDLTDIPDVNPELYRRVVDPFDGGERWAVPAIRPEVTVLAAAEADEEGTVSLGRFPFTDRLMALAAHEVLVQVERVVPAGTLADRGSPGATLPAFIVSAVVVAPGGCLPTASPGFYDSDETDIGGYLEAARDPATFAEWLAENVTAPVPRVIE